MDQITIDRSTLENYADCPQKGYLKTLFDAVRAEANGEKVFGWELERIKDADPILLADLRRAALGGTTNALCDTGILIHDMIDRAFKECEGNLELIPDWIVENIPRIRPDIQPDAIRAGKYIADQISDLHVKVLATETQISTPLTNDVVLTTRLDLLAQGLNNSLHIWDWKSGWKRRTASETVDSFQAQFTALLLWEQPCYNNVDVIHYWYMETRFGTRSYAKFSRNDEHPRLPHLTQSIAIKERIVQAVKLMLENDQSCWPSEEKCCQCDMNRFCAMSHIDAKEIIDDPKTFIDCLAYDIASVARRKKAATAWVKSKGPLIGTASVFDRKRPSEKFTCDMSELQAGKDYTKTRADAAPQLTGDDEVDSFFK